MQKIVLMVCALSFSFSVVALDSQQCFRDISNNVKPWAIDLNYQFPRTQSQGENGTCYMYSLMSTLSAALYRKGTNDHRLRVSDRRAFVKDYEFSPELTFLLLSIADPSYLDDRVEHAKRRSIEKAAYLGLFDSGDPIYTIRFVKKNPEVLIPIDVWKKVNWYSNVSQLIYREFNRTNELNGRFDSARSRAKIVKALLKIVSALQSNPETANFVTKLRQNGFSWDEGRNEFNFNRTSSRNLPLSTYEANSNNYSSCQSMLDTIFSAICKGIPVIVSTAKQNPGEDFERRHSSVVVGTIPIGKNGVLQATDLMIRDSARLTSESDNFNPHTGMVGMPLRKACETVITRSRIYQVQIILAPGESL